MKDLCGVVDEGGSKPKGNVFHELGFPPEDAAILQMRAELMLDSPMPSKLLSGAEEKPKVTTKTLAIAGELVKMTTKATFE